MVLIQVFLIIVTGLCVVFLDDSVQEMWKNVYIGLLLFFWGLSYYYFGAYILGIFLCILSLLTFLHYFVFPQKKD